MTGDRLDLYFLYFNNKKRKIHPSPITHHRFQMVTASGNPQNVSRVCDSLAINRTCRNSFKMFEIMNLQNNQYNYTYYCYSKNFIHILAMGFNLSSAWWPRWTFYIQHSNTEIFLSYWSRFAHQVRFKDIFSNYTGNCHGSLVFVIGPMLLF